MTDGPSPPWRTALAGLVRDAGRIDRTQSDPLVSARNAVGIAAPMAIGALSGNVAIGLAATIGALQTAFADRPGPYRLRILRMLATASVAAVTSTLAVLASRSDTAAVLVLLVFAFVAGLLVAGGPSATQVGVAGVGAALVLGHLPQPPGVAVHLGLLVLAGGAGQTVLAVAAWPLGRHGPERRALAGLYHELAAAARVPAGSRAAPPASDTVQTVRQTLYGLGHDHGPSVEAYRVLLDEAQRIRRETVVIVALAERLASDGNPILAGLVRASLTGAGTVLDAVAAALESGRSLDERALDRPREQVQRTIARLEQEVDAPAEPTRRAAAARLGALSGQLRAAVQTSGPGASEGRRPEWSAAGARQSRNPLPILRANLTWHSAVFRHALRLAVIVAGSDLVVRLAGIDRGYWVSLTVLVVLRADFGATLQRALLRTVGTVVGLLIATELVRVVPGGGWWQVVLIAVFAFGMRFAGPGNVALSAVSLSGLVVVLLEINGVPAHTTLVSRALATVAGGALAVVALLALPTWERQFVPERLAELLGAYRSYLVAIADPDSTRDIRERARTAARLARSNAQASVDRAEAEPVRARAEVDLGRAVLAHTHRFVQAALTIDAVRPQLHAAGPPAEFATFLAACADVLAAAQARLTASAPVEAPRSLRPLHDALAAALAAAPERAGGADIAATVVEATDRMANSLDTLTDEGRRQRVESARNSVKA